MFNMIKLTIVASLCLYLIAMALEQGSNLICRGWECEQVTCWDGYSVYIPEEKAYLPCEKFDEYLNGNKGVLIR